jgi:hypothetical protein
MTSISIGHFFETANEEFKGIDIGIEHIHLRDEKGSQKDASYSYYVRNARHNFTRPKTFVLKTEVAFPMKSW